MKITYRPEIDGLRAIAVGAVILYHAQITIFGYQPFKGGFIGVDIFFVISGYLITSIILKELVITGSFSFKNFYERRIRRILPALLFVMLVSLPFAWMYLLPGGLVDFSKSILYSLGFNSNFYFWHTETQYGAESGLLKPFLHTWSLSVEEQYYILFPIILLFAFKYFRKYLIHILILGFVISLSLSDWGSRNTPSFNFYILPTRGWELLAGSILAYFEIIRGHRSRFKTLNIILPAVGLILISYSILFFNDRMFHPSFYTLSPIVGVCLIIWFSNKNEMITKILSTKLFVGMGLISYSLYLWHYPIFAFGRISGFFFKFEYFVYFSILITILISIFSYFFIERKFRDKKFQFKIIFKILTVLYLLVIIFSCIIIFNNGFKNRVPKILHNSTEKPWNLLKNADGANCYGITKCIFNTTSNRKVFIIGDSHMASLTFDLKNRIIERNYQFITSTTLGGCLYFPGFSLANLKNKKQIHEACNFEYFENLKEILLKQKNSIIIFGGRFPLYISNFFFDNKEGGQEKDSENLKWPMTYVSNNTYKTIQESFKTEVSKLSENNKIILVYPIPEVGWNPNNEILSQWIESNFSIEKFDLKFISTSYEIYKDRTKLSFDLLDSIKSKNIFRVYPHTIFCDKLIKSRCVAHDDKNIFYSDSNHPSTIGAKLINELIINQIEKIEKNSN
jgi:peptidoglycan/LPS O-acetylase OafA/YrhL